MKRKVVKNNQITAKYRHRAFGRRLVAAFVAAAITMSLTAVGAAADEPGSISEEISIEVIHEEQSASEMPNIGDNTVIDSSEANKTEAEKSSAEKENTDTQIETESHDGEDGGSKEAVLTQYVDEYGNKYLLYPDGTHYTGWYEMKPFGELYFDPNADGIAITGIGFVSEDGKNYLFDSNGIVNKNSGTPVVEGSKYWIKDDGSIGTGWLILENWKLYFDPEIYSARTFSDGATDIEGKKYLFNNDGVMQNYAGTTVINGDKYWFSSDDASLKSGWLTLGSWEMYFDPETYKCATGVSDVEGKRYIFDSNGVLIKGTGTFIHNGKKYAYDGNGNAITGWLILGNWKMFFDKSTGEAAIGITKLNGNTYLFNDDGVMQNYAGTTIVNGKKYWFSDDDASLKSGWLNLNGSRLYFDPNTYAAYVSCTVKIDGYNCRFNNDGVLINDRERDKEYFKSLLTYNAVPGIYDGGIDFIRAAKNLVSDKSRGYGHTWPNTISCAGLVGLTLTHFGYGDFIKDDPLGWGYIDLGDEYVSTLVNECGATWYGITINGLNYANYLQPGDLLYYYHNNSYNHIAIYAGFGYTVEARGPSGPTEADDTGYEIGIYYLPNEAITYQGFFRLPNLHKI